MKCFQDFGQQICNIRFIISLNVVIHDHNKLHPSGWLEWRTNTVDESMWKSLVNEVCVLGALIDRSNTSKPSSQ